MNATRRMARLAVLVGLGLLVTYATPLAAQGSGSQSGKCNYGMAEYNTFTAASNEKNPAAQLKLLDDFVAKYPNSCLLNYVYPLYYNNYAFQKNFPKVIEYAKKELALPGLPPADQFYANRAIAVAVASTPNPDPALAKTGYQAAMDGIKAAEAIQKPEGADEVVFKKQIAGEVQNFHVMAANAALAAKDYQAAIQECKTILAANPDDFGANYNSGRAYQAMNPPQMVDALWSYARAASSKNAPAQQAAQVKAYIPKAITNFQGGTVCDPLSQSETNELLQLASTTADRPASYKLYSAAELGDARNNMTIAAVVADLKAGGDKAKLAWTAACGLEFPDVPSKILGIDVGTDVVELKLALVTSDAEFDAATTPNMEVKIPAPPATAEQKDKDSFDATKKLEKDNFMRFTGTLESYDPDPAFMLHWDKAKVNDEDLPKPGKKAPAKRPVKKQ